MELHQKSRSHSSGIANKWVLRTVGATLVGALILPAGFAMNQANAQTKAVGTSVAAKRVVTRALPSRSATSKRLAVSKKSIGRGAASKRTTPKVAVRKAPIRKVAVRKAPIRKVAVRKAPMRKVAVRKAPIRKVAVRKAPIRKVAANVASTNVLMTPAPKAIQAPTAAVAAGTEAGVGVSKKIAAASSTAVTVLAPVVTPILPVAPVLPTLPAKTVEAPRLPLINDPIGKTGSTSLAVGTTSRTPLSTHPVKVLKVNKASPTRSRPRLHRMFMIP
jgi:hypothetical protein